jgi:hypothetical protein
VPKELQLARTVLREAPDLADRVLSGSAQNPKGGRPRGGQSALARIAGNASLRCGAGFVH